MNDLQMAHKSWYEPGSFSTYLLVPFERREFVKFQKTRRLFFVFLFLTLSLLLSLSSHLSTLDKQIGLRRTLQLSLLLRLVEEDCHGKHDLVPFLREPQNHVSKSWRKEVPKTGCTCIPTTFLFSPRYVNTFKLPSFPETSTILNKFSTSNLVKYDQFLPFFFRRLSFISLYLNDTRTHTKKNPKSLYSIYQMYRKRRIHRPLVSNLK